MSDQIQLGLLNKKDPRLHSRQKVDFTKSQVEHNVAKPELSRQNFPVNFPPVHSTPLLVPHGPVIVE